MTKRSFEYRHVVGFEETNLVGNVYYVNQLRWQGRCREMFLREHAPDILDKLAEDLILATVHCGCEYLTELFAFDEVIVRMRLEKIVQNRIAMDFEYWRSFSPESEDLVARGKHQVACMKRVGSRTVPVPLPDSLREAFEAYL